MPAETTHLTPHDLAGRWKSSLGHLANLRSAGRGPRYLKLSAGKVLYTLADIEEYETARLVSAMGRPKAAA